MSVVKSVEVRPLHPGMGQAVAERTILRKKENREWETWGDVADRVAMGNSLLCPDKADRLREYQMLKKHLSKATTLMSGRHLQHGDKDQPIRNQEVFVNCATSASSFILFYLLLNGAGVGRCYDDDMMLVNWDNSPNIRVVLDENHKDFDWSAHESVRDAKHKYGSGRDTMWFKVPDSREGWAKALELWENATFEKIHKDKTLILDFSDVRCKGMPIGGMQSRPASGPVPLMNAFLKAASLKGAGLDPWRQNLYIDHYFAECVLVGGARRSARMSTKFYLDPNIFEFITVKRPIEFADRSMNEVLDLRQKYIQNGERSPTGFLWSSNNSVTVDAEFWRLIKLRRTDDEYNEPTAKHARKVLRLVTECAYADGTGEPGLINVDKLVRNDESWDNLSSGDYVGSKKYQLNEDTQIMMTRLARRAKKKQYNMIVNPCGEIPLNILGGYCTIADVVPFHADTLEEAEEAFRVTTRALIRVNLMDSLYKKEVQRTNRIGTGMTGVHEFAWKFFQVGFRDLVNPDFSIAYSTVNDLKTSHDPRVRAAAFWLTLSRFNRAVHDEAIKYSEKLGLVHPHTENCVKPSGSVSKLFGLSEGWHLPALAYMLRWVQFRHDDPLIEKYRAAGYPTRELQQYQGTVIVGFPTAPTIAELGMGDAMVLAGDATPEEQYKWLQLGEKYWIIGVDEYGNPNQDKGGQISYTLKYKPDRVDYKHFKEMLIEYQSQVKCCSVMPQEDAASYEYQPEQSVTKAEYEGISRAISKILAEDIGKEHIDCASGGCPVDFVADKS